MTGNEETQKLNSQLNSEKPEKSVKKKMKRNRKAYKNKTPKINDKEAETVADIANDVSSLDSGKAVVEYNTDNVETVEVNVNNENEEQIAQVTNLFRSMIGIDENRKSNVVRQFACKTCYRSWWRRVRFRKQVSKCIRCKVKYEPISDDEEFGIGEFKCTVCNHEFKTWSQKSSTAVCKTCNALCSPLKIMPANRKNKTTNNAANSSMFYPNYSNCQQCFGTCIDLNSNIIFRPQNYSYFEFVTPISNNYKKGTSFCPACRKIPVFSNTHVSTGSTLPSLSYQDDLDRRYYEDDDQALETCVEEEDESTNAQPK